MNVHDMTNFYAFVVRRYPELSAFPDRIIEEDGPRLGPFMDYFLTPLMINVGARGEGARRRRVFALVDELLLYDREIANEIGVFTVEMAPVGWFASAAKYAGPVLADYLDDWEPDWRYRSGRRTRAFDPYGVEMAIA